MAEESGEMNGGRIRPDNERRDRDPGFGQRCFEFIGKFGVAIAACILVFSLVAVISLILYKNGGVLKDLSDPANARGIITFMISLAAIGLAFLMVLHGLFGNADAEQFRRAREIYSGLMGVLGTIVGFYFGSGDRSVLPLSLSEPRVVTGDLITQISGGVAPYRYRITPDSLSGMATAEQRLSLDGWVQLPLKQGPVTEEVEVEVWDSKNAFVSRSYIPPDSFSPTANSNQPIAHPPPLAPVEPHPAGK